MTQTQTTQTAQTLRDNSDDRPIGDKLPDIKFSAWSEYVWSDSKQWLHVTAGYIVKCACGCSDYHLVMKTPQMGIRCVSKGQVIVLKYLHAL